jgi:hypothetical protein
MQGLQFWTVAPIRAVGLCKPVWNESNTTMRVLQVNRVITMGSVQGVFDRYIEPIVTSVRCPTLSKAS